MRKNYSYIFIAFGGLVFFYYLYFLFNPSCLKLGYTQCAEVGEDLFALYQGAYSFFHHAFIYGQSAKHDLVTPFFMYFKYFPISSVIWGGPVLLFKNAASAYFNFYLPLSISLYLLSVYLLILLGKKFQTPKPALFFAIFLWLAYFSLTAEWRMGQFNHLAGMFLLFAIAAEVFQRENIAAVSWILSLAWKPQALFALFYFWIRKNKLALWLFAILFVGFTAAYLIYWRLTYNFAFSQFFYDLLALGNRNGWQVHYVDNFSVNAFWAEIFYDWSPLFYTIFSKIYLAFILIVLAVVSYIFYQRKEKNLGAKIYFLLFCAATMSVFHREVWESHLTFWLPTLVTLILMTKNKKELSLIIICSILLASPSLFYIFDTSKLDIWRTLMIAEKALPQLVLWIYLVKKNLQKKAWLICRQSSFKLIGVKQNQRRQQFRQSQYQI